MVSPKLRLLSSSRHSGVVVDLLSALMLLLMILITGLLDCQMSGWIKATSLIDRASVDMIESRHSKVMYFQPD